MNRRLNVEETWLASPACAPQCVVRNDTHVLTGTGTISFGINPETSRPHLVKYAVNP